MKIAISVNSSWNIYNFRLGLAKHFMQKGFEVFAIAPEDEYSVKLAKEGLKFRTVEVESKGRNILSDFRYFLLLRKVYKEIQPDIILQFTIKPNIYGTLAAASLGIPVINNVSGLGTVFLHDNFSSKIAKVLYRFSFRFASKVFFQNKDDQSLFIENHLINSEKTSLVPGSGVDTEKFSPLKNSQKRDHFTFLVVARILYDKGIVEYIRAIELLKPKINATFQLAGALDTESELGIPQKDLDKWVNQKLIEYKGFVDDTLELYQGADCVVLPSYREGTPKSLLEAAACGIPLVATDVPGCKEVVDEGKNGYLCNVKDPEDLAKKMEAVYNLPPEQYISMANNSRQKAEKQFSEKIVIKMYEEAVFQIVELNG